MPLQKTSIQVDPETLKELEAYYRPMSRSEIIRLCVEYVRETKPAVEVGRTRLVPEGEDDATER